MASQDHLLAKTEILPVAAELDLVCFQFLASASRRDHPSHAVVNMLTGTRPGRKEIVHTLQSRFGHVVRPFLNDDGVLPEVLYKRTINAIHTSAVARSKCALKNRVLGTAPPDINPIESSLPRRSRTTLLQLRSDFCKDLKSFQARIGSSPDDMCLHCRGASHMTAHLFTCPAAPTTLTIRDMWSHPHETVDHLRSFSSFDHLPTNPFYLYHLLNHLPQLRERRIDVFWQTNQPTNRRQRQWWRRRRRRRTSNGGRTRED
jgi:hypothetical protein